MRKNKKNDPSSDYTEIRATRLQLNDHSIGRKRFVSTDGDTMRKEQSELRISNRYKELPRGRAATKKIREK